MPKIDNTADIMLHCIMGQSLPIHHASSPEELMTREKLILEKWHQKSPTYGHVTKLFLESEFQHKESKQMKNKNFQQNLVVFSAATDSENLII